MQTRQFPWEYQMDAKGCGPACIKMIAKYYGKSYQTEVIMKAPEQVKIPTLKNGKLIYEDKRAKKPEAKIIPLSTDVA